MDTDYEGDNEFDASTSHEAAYGGNEHHDDPVSAKSADGLTSRDESRIGKGAVIAGVAIEALAPAAGPLYPVVAAAGAAVLITGLVEEWIADEHTEPAQVPTLHLSSHEETTMHASYAAHEDMPPAVR